MILKNKQIFSAYESIISGNETLENDFFIALAQHVGANEKFDVKKFETIINKYKKEFKDDRNPLYRLWQDLEKDDLDDSQNRKLKVSIESQPFYSTTKSLNVIPKLVEAADLDDDDNYLISKHLGEGLDVIEILTLAKNKKTIDEKDRRYIANIISTYSWQQEVLYLNPIKTLNIYTLFGYFKDKKIIKFTHT